MNKGITCVIAFTLGAAAGAVVSWKMLNAKYKKIADDEIESMREYYSSRAEKKTCETDDVADESAEDTHKDEETYRNMAKRYDKTGQPYVISPNEFDEHDDYEVVSLTYYSDGILTNEFDEIMDDEEIEHNVGRDSLTHFGEFDDDSVFVRNDRLKCDYEILRDPKTYDEVHHT